MGDQEGDEVQVKYMGDISWALSLFNSPALTNAALRVPIDLWKLPPKEITQWANPTPMEHILRKQLWVKAAEASVSGKEIRLRPLVQGICSYTNWWARILKNPYKVVWLISVPVTREILLSSAWAQVTRLLQCLERGESIQISDVLTEKRIYEFVFLLNSAPKPT